MRDCKWILENWNALCPVPNELDVDIGILRCMYATNNNKGISHACSQQRNKPLLGSHVSTTEWTRKSACVTQAQVPKARPTRSNKWTKGKDCWWLRLKRKRLCKEKRQKNFEKTDFSRSQDIKGKTSWREVHETQSRKNVLSRRRTF